MRSEEQGATVSAYDAFARAYRDATRELPDNVRAELAAFVAALDPEDRVLEIGSGGGRDAAYLEGHGLRVRRTDVTAAFVELLREAGHAADVVDPLTDDLADPAEPDRPWDAVWANASLLHVARSDLGTVLTRLHAATRPGGLLRFSVKEGDGEGWSTHGRVGLPRHFTYWREPELRAVAEGAGWAVERVDRADGLRDDRWLEVWARR